MECSKINGTVKDRVALFMLRKAEDRSDLPHPSSQQTNPLNDTCTKKTLSSSNGNKTEGNNLLEQTIANALLRTKTGGIVVEGTSGSTGI